MENGSREADGPTEDRFALCCDGAEILRGRKATREIVVPHSVHHE
jgi:hypothetical protein